MYWTRHWTVPVHHHRRRHRHYHRHPPTTTIIIIILANPSDTRSTIGSIDMIMSSVRLSVCLSVCCNGVHCGPAKWFILYNKSVWASEYRKCPLGTRFYNFQPLTPIMSPETPLFLNQRRWCHLLNKLKHIVDKRTAKISTSGIAMVSRLPMAIPEFIQWSAVMPYVIRSTIGFLCNSWALGLLYLFLAVYRLRLCYWYSRTRE